VPHLTLTVSSPPTTSHHHHVRLLRLLLHLVVGLLVLTLLPRPMSLLLLVLVHPPTLLLLLLHGCKGGWAWRRLASDRGHARHASWAHDARHLHAHHAWDQITRRGGSMHACQQQANKPSAQPGNL
jgi:hypothetical protein